MKKVIAWFPVILWALVIFSFSSLPVAQTSQIYWQDFIFKKTAHVVEYCILCILVYRALKINTELSTFDIGFYAVLLTVLYAFSDEFHQGFTPGREPTVRDIIFDTIGAVGAIFILWKLLPKMPTKLKTLAQKLQIS